MAFTMRRLSVLAYANGFTLWHYKAEADAPADAAEPGYFDEAADMLSAGDLMMVSGKRGAAMLAVAHAAIGEPVALTGLC